MAETTGIGWTGATWNPWMGCTKVSPGCAHCYMFREQLRYKQNPELVRLSKTKFFEPLKWKTSKLIFTCSWSDWFHEAADGWRDEAWDVIRRTPQHTYQILTKRPERMADHMPKDWGKGWGNVWLGTSVENQRWIERVPKLLEIPAPVHFVSAEPLLGALDLSQYLAPVFHATFGDTNKPPHLRDTPSLEVRAVHAVARAAGKQHGMAFVDWVIVGGESGEAEDLPRPMDLSWARMLRDQCQLTTVPFFLKQMGGFPDPLAHDKAVLDGRTWTEMPTVV